MPTNSGALLIGSVPMMYTIIEVKKGATCILTTSGRVHPLHHSSEDIEHTMSNNRYMCT